MAEDLVRWLGEQLDEDERIAREAAMAVGRTGYKDGVLVDPPARWGDALVADGRQWGARYHAVARKRLSEGEPSVTVAECAGFGGSPVAKHVAEHDPARVLREIDAKRGVVARYEFACREAAARDIDEGERETRVRVAGALQSCVHVLALPYADRPGYLEEWRP